MRKTTIYYLSSTTKMGENTELFPNRIAYETGLQGCMATCYEDSDNQWDKDTVAEKIREKEAEGSQDPMSDVFSDWIEECADSIADTFNYGE